MPPACRIAILAKAPIAGYAKTRLVPALGRHGAARLQRAFTLATLRTAHEAALGPVVLWCAPDAGQRFFRALQRACGIDCRSQPAGDLGARMLCAAQPDPGAAASPVLLIGTDCPGLRASHLAAAAQALHAGHDAVFIPAEDGGYVLVGLRQPQPALFEPLAWGTAQVMEATRRRAAMAGLGICELAPLWDVDTPRDLHRLRQVAHNRP